MQEITFTPSTVIFLILIAAGVVWAVRRLHKRGMCDCDDHCGDKGSGGCPHCSSACSSASDCGAVQEMLKKMDSAASKDKYIAQPPSPLQK